MFIICQSASYMLSFDVNTCFLLQKLAILCLVKVWKGQNWPKTKIIWMKFYMGDMFMIPFIWVTLDQILRDAMWTLSLSDSRNAC